LCGYARSAARTGTGRERPLAAKAVDLLGRWRAGSTLRPSQRFPSSCHAKSAAVEATSRRSPRAGTWLATLRRNALPVAVQVSSRRICPSLNSESYWQVSLAAAVSLGSAAVSLRILGRHDSTARWRDDRRKKSGRASGARSALGEVSAGLTQERASERGLQPSASLQAIRTPGETGDREREHRRPCVRAVVRAIEQQARMLDELRSRTGLLLTGASIVASFLGERAQQSTLF
jgi:hypothetical protein